MLDLTLCWQLLDTKSETEDSKWLYKDNIYLRRTRIRRSVFLWIQKKKIRREWQKCSLWHSLTKRHSLTFTFTQKELCICHLLFWWYNFAESFQKGGTEWFPTLLSLKGVGWLAQLTHIPALNEFELPFGEKKVFT